MEDPLLSYGNFKCLGDSDQEEYFSRMAGVSRIWKDFDTSCPRIDKMVFEHYEANNRLTAVEREAAYSLQELIKKKWRLSKTPLPEPKARHALRNVRETTRWYDDDLRWNSVDSRFEFEQSQDPQPKFLSIDDIERPIRQHGFLKHISSALLLYRLNILAGKFKEVESDRYKASWDMTFATEMASVSSGCGTAKEEPRQNSPV
ncbi:uncharacterized protein N7473_001704 [Penicillium subrubescens]|nr:uncharacterized protein N7473_001704 [Penicillium subrubescens]KAJ5904788.1 hypothetical protein N7473_001704 [Penicillium subrubescens]